MTDSSRTEIKSGIGTAIVLAHSLALIDSAVGSAAAMAIEGGLMSGRGLEEIVAELSMLGFASLPSFAMVVVSGTTTRIIHRGKVEVGVLHGDGATTTFYQPSVSTWREEAIDGIVEVRASIRRDLATDVPSGRGHWLHGTGVVPADEVTWRPPRDVTLGGTADDEHQQRIDHVDAPVLSAPRVPDADAALATRPEPLAPIERIERIVDATKPPDRDEEIVEPLPSPVSAVVLPSDVEAMSVDAVAVPASVMPLATGEDVDLDFAHFVDHTVFRRAEDAAVRPVEHDDAVSEEPLDLAPSVYMSLDTLMPERIKAPSVPLIDCIPGLGRAAVTATTQASDADHDGHTVARPRRRAASSVVSPTIESVDGPVLVQSVFCAQGHPNPASASTCRSCGDSITDRSARMHERPSLGSLRFSTGQSVSLVKPLLIGRNPPPSQQLDGHPAVIIGIDNSELSRLHAAVHLVEWHVHVDDQGSTNGTVVTLPGLSPQTLRPFEKVQISVGTVVDLGGAVSFSFERA